MAESTSELMTWYTCLLNVGSLAVRVTWMYRWSVVGLFFFFQAEDGIRDLIVTGVQTCALPISGPGPGAGGGTGDTGFSGPAAANADVLSFQTNLWVNISGSDRCGGCHQAGGQARSEERRVGKEGRSRWAPYH